MKKTTKKQPIKQVKNNMLLIYILLISIIFMVAGYAILSQNISVNGTATSNTSFAIAWVNPTITDSHGLTGGIPTLSVGDSILTINPEFDAQGAFIEVTVDIKNNGNIPAVITDVVPTDPLGGGIEWSINPPINLAETLAPGASRTIVIRIEYPIESLVEGPISETFGLVVTYSQET